MALRALCPSETARAPARWNWQRRTHRFGKLLHCCADDKRSLSGSHDMRDGEPKLALAFKSRAQRAVFGLKSLDACAQIAGCAH
jgi:hypothetical protein